jgi:hypothetical protein
MKLFLSSFFAYLTLAAVAQSSPGPMEDPSFIYHPASKSMVLLGGAPLIQDSAQSDVWTWDGAWKKIEARGPGARVFFKGAVDPKTGNITMFGGAALARSQQFMGDLWSFDGRKWSLLPANAIGSKDHFKMVYADHLGAFIIYGGTNGRNVDSTTWILRDGQLKALRIAGPGNKYHSGMIYDKHRKKVVLYGGGVKPGEHWEFDGVQWEKRTFDVSPGNKLYHSMAYDENEKAIIVQAGAMNQRTLDPANLVTPSTWMFQEDKWKKIAEENIFPIAMGYHPVRKSILAYAYDNGDAREKRKLQLWELKNMKWTLLADYGVFNATEFLEKYLEQKPGDLSARYAYGNALRLGDRLEEAETVFRQLTETDIPQKQHLYRTFINMLINAKKYPDAEFYLSRFVPLADTRSLSLMNYNIACGYALNNQPDKAFPLLFKAVQYGYNKKSDYENDADLVSLKGDARWNEFAAQLK